MFQLLLIIIAAFEVDQIKSVPVIRNPIEGYYWREFTGGIPRDAFSGGSDHNNQPIYIGQALYDGKLIVGKIYGSDKKMHFGLLYNERITNQDTKILCTQEPDNFAWISTTIDGISLLTDHHLVLGGRQQANIMLYIGRAYYGSETGIGKVHMNEPPYNTFWLAFNGTEVAIASFQILTYNTPN